MRKTESPKMVSKWLKLHYLRTIYVFFTNLKFDDSKNTNVNQQKSKNHEELNFSREKVQKYEKNWKSKDDFSEPEINLNSKDLSSRLKVRKVLKKKKLSKKSDFRSKKILKKVKVQKWCQNGSNSII